MHAHGIVGAKHGVEHADHARPHHFGGQAQGADGLVAHHGVRPGFEELGAGILAHDAGHDAQVGIELTRGQDREQVILVRGHRADEAPRPLHAGLAQHLTVGGIADQVGDGGAELAQGNLLVALDLDEDERLTGA
ncbi:MAG: hypothetical protein AUG80_00215 [Candidatus Rokubacteria bacterium 13_1_20CM_4_68_9]|nr:MAG: hypothetical protein AUG80_00215 [Candidatus Rokubacteria bacterium 13_1_20CM_4_68_9]